MYADECDMIQLMPKPVKRMEHRPVSADGYHNIRLFGVEAEPFLSCQALERGSEFLR